MSIYIFDFGRWIKLGYATHGPYVQRASGFWHLQHPQELCGQLDQCQLIQLWSGTLEQEQALQQARDQVDQRSRTIEAQVAAAALAAVGRPVAGGDSGGGGPPSDKGSSGNSMDEHWRSVARSEIKKAATEQYRKRVADFSAKRRKTAGGSQRTKEDEDDGDDDLFGDDLDAEMEALTEAAMAAIPKSRF